jgi:hypothetical protein
LDYRLATDAEQFSGVGSYPIAITLGDNANYSVTPTNSKLRVGQKTVTVIADTKAKTYGDDNPALTAVVKGTVNEDTLDYELATTAVQFSGVGSYPIAITLGSNPNYAVSSTDALLTVGQKAVTVIADLAIAVVVGVIVSALVFAWKHAAHIHARTHTDDDGWKVYELDGPLFFGSVLHFKDLFDPQNDPQDVVIDFNDSRVWDSSGIDAIDGLADKYKEQGKKLHIRHISPECRQLMTKAQEYVEMNLNEDPRYHIATDKLG